MLLFGLVLLAHLGPLLLLLVAVVAAMLPLVVARQQSR